jgi:hypothetical protein
MGQCNTKTHATTCGEPSRQPVGCGLSQIEQRLSLQCQLEDEVPAIGLVMAGGSVGAACGATVGRQPPSAARMEVCVDVLQRGFRRKTGADGQFIETAIVRAGWDEATDGIIRLAPFACASYGANHFAKF